MHQDYPEPVGALLSYGDPWKIENNPDDPNGWPNYVTGFGLSSDQVPHLIRMLKDPVLEKADSKDPRVWAGLHAWRALAQLGAVEAIPDLIRCLDYEDEDEVSDWSMEEIPEVLSRIGTASIEPLSHYLNDSTKDSWSLAAASQGLASIAQTNPETRADCIKKITDRLEDYVKNGEDLNGFLICDLMNLKAVESLDVIRKAFRADVVDISIGGDLEDVEIELGVRQTRSIPRPHYHPCGTQCHEDHGDEEAQWARSLLQIQSAPKIGRNDPCPCGSGKKYKKCCLD